MTAPVLTFFNNTAGVGKTSLIYRLAWMFAAMDKRVLIADFDPQARLTAACLDEQRIEAVCTNADPGATIYRSVQSLSDARDIAPPSTQSIATNIDLLPGDVALSGFDDLLCAQWSNSLGGGNLYRPMRLLAAFGQLMRRAAHELRADMILADTGPSLGAINRSVLLASDYVAIVLGTDFFSLRGLSGLGPTLKHWKALWQKRLENWRASPQGRQYPDFRPRASRMQPIGYLCRQHGVRLDRPITADDRWVKRIPGVYREALLDEAPVAGMTQNDDPYCLAIMKPYRSLLPIAEERRKPIFKLTSADGAIGSHAGAVADARKEFRQLAVNIAIRMGIEGQPP